MKRLWLLCPVNGLNNIVVLSSKLQKFGESLVTYIEKKQDDALKELEHELHSDKE